MSGSLINIDDEINAIVDKDSEYLLYPELVKKVVEKEYNKVDYTIDKVILILKDIIEEARKIYNEAVGEPGDIRFITNVVFDRKYQENYKIETVINIFKEIFEIRKNIIDSLELITNVVNQEYEKEGYNRETVIEYIKSIKRIKQVTSNKINLEPELHEKRHLDKIVLATKMKEFSGKLVFEIKLKNKIKAFKILNEVYEFLKTNSEKSDVLDNDILRRLYFSYFSWAIPSEIAIDNIIKFLVDNKCIGLLEIGSGTGLWASLLQISNSSVKVIPTDDSSWYKGSLRYTDIEIIDYKNAIKYTKPDYCLFLCWPPKYEDLASYSLTNFNGKYLIYIGYPKGGETANDEFFSILDKEWNLIKRESIHNWYNIYDSIYYYSRKINSIVELDGKRRSRKRSKRSAKRRYKRSDKRRSRKSSKTSYKRRSKKSYKRRSKSLCHLSYKKI